MPSAWCRFRVCLLHAAAPVVCCILCVASVPCCALVVEYNASRMLLLVRFALLAAHEMRRCRVFPVASRMCSRALARRLLSDARCLLHALPGLRRLLRGGCCMPHVALLACWLVALFPVVNGLSQIPRCPLHAALCCVAVVRYIFPGACCMLSVVGCTLSSGVGCTLSSGRLRHNRRHALRWIVSACPFFVACPTWSAACCPSPQCPMSHGVR
jgi:hypothetical protein